MLQSNEIEAIIREKVNITGLRILQAKSFLLNYNSYIEECIIDIPTALNEFLALNNISIPDKFTIYEDHALLTSQIDLMAAYFEYSISFCESVLSLVNSTIFIGFNTHTLNISHPYVKQNDISGNVGYFKFSKFRIHCPLRIKKLLSTASSSFIFSDPDLFILEARITNAHPDVIEALSDSINCFKRDMFRPSITMLGKAVEGAWIELGISLLKYVKNKKQDSDKIIERFMGRDDFVWKLEQVIKLYNRQDWFEEISYKSGIKSNHLTEIFYWTDVVRDSRNAIHFGAEPTTPNTYEKASILLLVAVKHLRTLYKLKTFTDLDTSLKSELSWI